MSKVSETYTISVCPDCVMGLHYGLEETASQLHGAYDCDTGGYEMVEQWANGFRLGSQGIEMAGSQSDEPYFSWSKCDICEGIAGDRYDMEVTQS